MNQVSSFQYNPKGVSQKVPERLSQFTEQLKFLPKC